MLWLEFTSCNFTQTTFVIIHLYIIDTSVMSLIPIIFLICLIIGFYLVYSKLKDLKRIKQVTSLTRGEWSERRLILELLKEDINPKAIFHDLYIQKTNGQYTQVDVAVATKAGIIVFEVKDYSGWIFGNEHQKYWTQLLAYGNEKYRFYNPVMQNAGHIQAIRRCLSQNPGIPIYSVIVFFGKCKFKNITCNADNTFIIHPRSIRHVVSEILMQPDANFGNKYEIMNLFTQAVQNGNDPEIVTSQINSAAYYAHQKPHYTHNLASLFRFGLFSYRRKYR